MTSLIRLPGVPSVSRGEPLITFHRATRERVENDWSISSMDLRDGLDVREIFETIPAELLDLG